MKRTSSAVGAGLPRGAKNKKASLRYVLVFLTILEPLLFKNVAFAGVNRVYTGLRILVFLCLLFDFVTKRAKIDGFLASVVALQVTYFLCTLLFEPSGLIESFAGPALSTVSVSLLFAVAKGEEFWRLLESAKLVLLCYLVINLGTVLIAHQDVAGMAGLGRFVSGVSADQYFLGMDNRFIFYYLLTIAVVAALNLKSGQLWDVSLVFVLIQGLLTLIGVWAVGGMVGMVLISAYLLFIAVRVRGRFLNAMAAVVATSVVAIALQLAFYSSWDITLIDLSQRFFNKVATLISRVGLWHNTISLIRMRHGMGIGVQAVDVVRGLIGGSGHPHNLWLYVLLRGGVVGLLAFYWMLGEGVIKAYRHRTTLAAIVFTGLLLSCFVIDLADSYDDTSFYLLLAVVRYFDYTVCESEPAVGVESLPHEETFLCACAVRRP